MMERNDSALIRVEREGEGKRVLYEFVLRRFTLYLGKCYISSHHMSSSFHMPV
jgi:hypothetical protein